MAKAKKEIWYRYTFEDGCISITRGLSRCELSHEIREHGKLISKVIEGIYYN